MSGASSIDRGPHFYSVSKVAKLLGISTMTLYRAIEANQFPAIRVRGRLIVPARALEDMADAAIHMGTVVDAAEFVRPAS